MMRNYEFCDVWMMMMMMIVMHADKHIWRINDSALTIKGEMHNKYAWLASFVIKFPVTHSTHARTHTNTCILRYYSKAIEHTGYDATSQSRSSAKYEWTQPCTSWDGPYQVCPSAQISGDYTNYRVVFDASIAACQIGWLIMVTTVYSDV